MNEVKAGIITINEARMMLYPEFEPLSEPLPEPVIEKVPENSNIR